MYECFAFLHVCASYVCLISTEVVSPTWMLRKKKSRSLCKQVSLTTELQSVLQIYTNTWGMGGVKTTVKVFQRISCMSRERQVP